MIVNIKSTIIITLIYCILINCKFETNNNQKMTGTHQCLSDTIRQKVNNYQNPRFQNIFDINSSIRNISIQNFNKKELSDSHYINNDIKQNIASITFHNNGYFNNKLKLFLNEKEKINLFKGYIKKIESLYIPKELIKLIWLYWYQLKPKLTSQNTFFEYIKIYKVHGNVPMLSNQIREVDSSIFFCENLNGNNECIYYKIISRFNWIKNSKKNNSKISINNFNKKDFKNSILFAGDENLKKIKNENECNNDYCSTKVIRLIIRNQLVLLFEPDKIDQSIKNKLFNIFNF